MRQIAARPSTTLRPKPNPAPRRDDWRQEIAGRSPRVRTFHILAALWVVAMFVAANVAPDWYDAAMQEDRPVEWLTAMLFLFAGLFGLSRARRRRAVGDGLVALFCFAAAGEEISWGQRLLGFTPPSAFLERNTQQELNLHNFADVLGRPKWTLILILLSYGVLLPVLMRTPVRALLDRIRLTPPSLGFTPWFAAAVVLLIVYPLEFTGEWVEALAGALFLVAPGFTGGNLGLAVLLSVGAAFGLTELTSRLAPRDPATIACARAEVDALALDVTSGSAATLLLGAGEIHKRAWTAAADGYLQWRGTERFQKASCTVGDAAEREKRRQYGVDPWGTAYWLATTERDGRVRATVYSFGPNRRRDGRRGSSAGDDITAGGLLRTVDESGTPD